jgi:hypothetical protein
MGGMLFIPPIFLSERKNMISVHGFRIVEIRNGQRIDCFHNRPTVRKYSVARIRVFDLARDRRWSHLAIRKFEIWDGIKPIKKFVFENRQLVSEKDYLLFTLKRELDKDYELSVRNRKIKQYGHVRGDLNLWIKDDQRLPRELAQMALAKDYNPCEKQIKREFGSGNEMKLSHPTELKDRKWYWERMKVRLQKAGV